MKIKNLSKLMFGLLLLAWGTVAFVGCDCEEDCYIVGEDDPPTVPRGLYSITGDEEVYLYWYPNDDWDLNFYVIYRSSEELGPYYEIGKSYSDPDFVDRNVTNGVTYYYAVSAVDDDLYESDLSYETVFDTPRPEGYSVRVYNYYNDPEVSAFEFYSQRVVDGDDPDGDIWFDYIPEQGVFYINVMDEMTDLQDYGYTETLDDAGWAPDEGWSELGYSEVIVGHTYIIWTRDNHFAKIRVTDINYANGWVKFDWAYQTDTGNPELKRAPKVIPERAPGYGDKFFAQNNGQ